MKLEPRPEPSRVLGQRGASLNIEPRDDHRTVQVWAHVPALEGQALPAEQHGVALDLPGVLGLIDLLSATVPYLSRGYAADHVTEAARAAADVAGEHLAVVVPMSGRVRPPADHPPPPDEG